MPYVRLKDIAERANVSINTVSRALKGRSDIGLETQKRIRAIADELGYIPDATAARLRSQENLLIGVVITHIDNPFFARVLRGVNDGVAENGYTIMALTSAEDIQREKNLLRTLGANRVAGIIIVPAQDTINTLDYDRLGIPHITIVRKGSGHSGSYFINNSYRSGELAGGLFVESGRRAPGYVGFDCPVSCNRDRELGFRKTLEAAGAAVSSERFIHAGPTEESAYQATMQLIERQPAVDFLFVYNDLMALGVLKALHVSGRRIPDDVRVVGHDDVSASSYYVPALSTIRVPKYQLGYDSATALAELIDNPGSPEKQIVYEPELIVRDT